MSDTAPTESGDSPLSWPSQADVLPEGVELSEPEVEETETPAEETETETETETPAEEKSAEEPEVKEETEKVETFDREYVEKLRNQAAEYRVQAKEFHEAFDGFDEASRSKFLDMAQALNDESRHVEVAREFLRIGKNIMEAYGEDVGDLKAPDPDAPLTLRQIEEREARQRAEAENQARVDAINKEVTDLGYELGSPDHYALLRLAQETETGDLKEAHTKVEAWKKGIIDAFIAETRQKQETHLTTAPQTGVAPKDPGDEPDLSWEGTRGRLDRFLTDMAG